MYIEILQASVFPSMMKYAIESIPNIRSSSIAAVTCFRSEILIYTDSQYFCILFSSILRCSPSLSLSIFNLSEIYLLTVSKGSLRDAQMLLVLGVISLIFHSLTLLILLSHHAGFL